MTRQPPVARRTISSALQKKGWLTTTSVDGYVLVRPRGGPLGDGFGAEVKAEVEALGYAPTVSRFTRGGVTWIRVTTPETIAQDDRGRH